jgi:hypothetical protein
VWTTQRSASEIACWTTKLRWPTFHSAVPRRQAADRRHLGVGELQQVAQPRSSLLVLLVHDAGLAAGEQARGQLGDRLCTSAVDRPFEAAQGSSVTGADHTAPHPAPPHDVAVNR